MARAYRRTICIAKISRRRYDLFNQYPSVAIREALSAGRPVEWWKRVWRVSEPLGSDERFFAGPLGFDRIAQREETRYDNSQHRYITETAPAVDGHFVYLRVPLRGFERLAVLPDEPA